MDEIKYLILGCGYAGMAAAKHIHSNDESDYVIVEQSNKPGGIASSFKVNNFTFDVGIHGLYTKKKDIIDTLNLDNQSADRISIKIADYYKGFWTSHPAYLHLKGMPSKITDQIFSELSSNENSLSRIKSFKDWAYHYLGKTYSDEIQIPYTEKFWSTSAESLSNDWIEHRLKKPTIDDILNGLVNDIQPEHYVKHLYYPKQNGFGEIASNYSQGLKVKYNCRVEKIDINKKIVRFADGSVIKYHKLIYTLPLVSLPRFIVNCPEIIINSCHKLSYTSLLLVSLCLKTDSNLDNHWVYAIDKEIPFSRLSKPSLWSPNNSPEHKSSLQAEIYLSNRSISKGKDYYVDNTLHSLRKMKIIDNFNVIDFADFRYYDIGNVIYDFERNSALEKINNFTATNQIVCCGRYAKWDYSLIDEVISSTEREINKLLQNRE